ncbi:MAG: hypothetical protein RLZZ590_486, partial [Actinomycetota bacterium]
MAIRKKTEHLLPEISSDFLWQVTSGSHHDPHSLLGAHPHEKGWVIRTLRPMAKSVTAVFLDAPAVGLEHLENGLWQGFVMAKKSPDYRIEATYA